MGLLVSRTSGEGRRYRNLEKFVDRQSVWVIEGERVTQIYCISYGASFNRISMLAPPARS